MKFYFLDSGIASRRTLKHLQQKWCTEQRCRYRVSTSQRKNLLSGIFRNSPEIFIQKLREYMRRVRAKPTSHHIKQKVFIHKELEECTHIFVRVDRSRRSLEQPYEGPFQVIQRLTNILYKIDYKGQPVEINVDRLKPAFIEEIQDTEIDNSPPESLEAETEERKHPGRRIRFVTP